MNDRVAERYTHYQSVVFLYVLADGEGPLSHAAASINATGPLGFQPVPQGSVGTKAGSPATGAQRRLHVLGAAERPFAAILTMINALG